MLICKKFFKKMKMSKMSLTIGLIKTFIFLLFPKVTQGINS